MKITSILEKIPDFGRDTRLNLETVLTVEGAPGLLPGQIAGIAVACAYATLDLELADAIHGDHAIAPEVDQAAKSAATIMAMNNVYYRFLHLSEDPEFKTMPARLRMNVIGKPGIAKVDFELMSLAVSAIAGCGMCIQSHISEARKGGISNEGIQSAIRIASVIQSAKTARAIA